MTPCARKRWRQGHRPGRGRGRRGVGTDEPPAAELFGRGRRSTSPPSRIRVRPAQRRNTHDDEQDILNIMTQGDGHLRGELGVDVRVVFPRLDGPPTLPASTAGDLLDELTDDTTPRSAEPRRATSCTVTGKEIDGSTSASVRAPFDRPRSTTASRRAVNAFRRRHRAPNTRSAQLRRATTSTREPKRPHQQYRVESTTMPGQQHRRSPAGTASASTRRIRSPPTTAPAASA